MTRARKLIVGLTGGIGCGKSTVLAWFKRRGIPGISSDALACACLQSGTPSFRKTVRRFGPGILDRRGRINRKALAAIVFASAAKRRQLERIVHPCVIAGLKRFAAGRRGIVVLDIPLLFEARLEKQVDVTLCVWCTRRQQIERIRGRSGWSRRDILRRIRAQWPLDHKAKKADIVLDNSGTSAELGQQLRFILKELRAR